jgi:hypothetical protein
LSELNNEDSGAPIFTDPKSLSSSIKAILIVLKSIYFKASINLIKLLLSFKIFINTFLSLSKALFKE